MSDDMLVLVVPTSRRLRDWIALTETDDMSDILVEAIDIAWYDTDDILRSVVESCLDAKRYPHHNYWDLLRIYKELVDIVRDDLFDKVEDIDNYMYSSELYEMRVVFNMKHWVVIIDEPDYH